MILSVRLRRSGRSPDCRAKPAASVHLYTSESEYTGPCCGASLLPCRRRKLSMRPLASSNFSIDGMLFSKFVWRRAAQKPEGMVTACTGTFRNLAWGDWTRLSTPWFFQWGFVEEPTAEDDAVSSFRDGDRWLSGMEATAAVEMAEPTNWRREISGLFVMLTSQKNWDS